MKCGKKLEKLIDLERRLDGKLIESKIAEFGSRFAKKSTSEVDRNFQIRDLRKTKNEIEID